ncbi:hypothetical protein ACJMK2_028996 [Sinanodonta woodiana]|uniref:Uncharacterized protein n=1 Tax=Sinanodonta woodiana TaxID=1069815 RepID=A0ABD3X8U1_SINWO
MYRQVRKNRFGSTRRVDICKEYTIKEVEAVAKSIFFPNGTSPNGSIEDFDFEIRDISEEKTECKEIISRSKNPPPQYTSNNEMRQMPTLAEPVDKPHTEFDKTQGLRMQGKSETEHLSNIDVFKKGFTDFSSVGLEDLLDALDDHECRTKSMGTILRLSF